MSDLVHTSCKCSSIKMIGHISQRNMYCLFKYLYELHHHIHQCHHPLGCVYANVFCILELYLVSNE